VKESQIARNVPVVYSVKHRAVSTAEMA
jgi:hypothetical protein